jgi:coproporphyrinogen III oxidase-like Fe-S oxidoreductase
MHHNNAALSQYVDYLIKEIRLLRNFCRHAPEIEQIAINGGMQMLLDRHQFERLVQALHQNFKLSQKTIFSITLNPRFCRNTSISIYREIGISEITINAQNLLRSNDKQTATHQEIITLDAIYTAQHTGFTTIRITLDCNIGESRKNKFDAALEKIMNTHPNRIDLNQFGESAEKNVTEDQIHARLQTAHLLSNAGYIHIGLN